MSRRSWRAGGRRPGAFRRLSQTAGGYLLFERIKGHCTSIVLVPLCWHRPEALHSCSGPSALHVRGHSSSSSSSSARFILVRRLWKMTECTVRTGTTLRVDRGGRRRSEEEQGRQGRNRPRPGANHCGLSVVARGLACGD